MISISETQKYQAGPDGRDRSDGEDLIALALGQELMLALRHADSRPQKVICASGQWEVKRHSMWTDMDGA